ncbi:unnamed protein product [Linum tenue]|uniref:Secreted protein n=1 Tax=Linum tenue TaxID=586396 RepID=A0AAV0IEU3_9ROSI|nr:unnamed protein product [Linum tenue]
MEENPRRFAAYNVPSIILVVVADVALLQRGRPQKMRVAAAAARNYNAAAFWTWPTANITTLTLCKALRIRTAVDQDLDGCLCYSITRNELGVNLFCNILMAIE